MRSSRAILNDMVIFQDHRIISDIPIGGTENRPATGISINIEQHFIIAAALVAIRTADGPDNLRLCHAFMHSSHFSPGGTGGKGKYQDAEQRENYRSHDGSIKSMNSIILKVVTVGSGAMTGQKECVPWR